MEIETIKFILEQTGFVKIEENKYRKDVDDVYAVDAYINGMGIILHLIEDEIETNKMTIQADTPKDFTDAYLEFIQKAK